MRVDNVSDRQYIGSVIVSEANDRFYEPAPTRNAMVGVQASLQFCRAIRSAGGHAGQ